MKETQRDRIIAELTKPPLTDLDRAVFLRRANTPFKMRGMETSEGRKRGETFKVTLTPGKVVRLK